MTTSREFRSAFARGARSAALAFVLATAWLIMPAAAQSDRERISVIELFTSQGCSSCPPADALLKRYSDRRDVVALTMAVDYWDYLGWKDTLASPKFSARQRAYAKARRDGAVYTPQAVVNGTIHVNGSDRAQIDEAIERTSRKSEPAVSLTCRTENGAMVVEVGNAAPGQAVKDGTLWLAVVQPQAEIPVKHGENRGRTLAYYNVVRELTPVGMWSGKATTVRLPHGAFETSPGARFAILLQQESVGPILAAAWAPARR